MHVYFLFCILLCTTWTQQLRCTYGPYNIKLHMYPAIRGVNLRFIIIISRAVSFEMSRIQSRIPDTRFHYG
jgi:hypothetical protein